MEGAVDVCHDHDFLKHGRHQTKHFVRAELPLMPRVTDDPKYPVKKQGVRLGEIVTLAPSTAYAGEGGSAPPCAEEFRNRASFRVVQAKCVATKLASASAAGVSQLMYLDPVCRGRG